MCSAFDGETATKLAIAANDRLYETCQRHPDRFAGFATLASPAPRSGSRTSWSAQSRIMASRRHDPWPDKNGEFIDQKKFWPIFARAEALDVPIYIHPAVPHQDVVKAYYADYLPKYPSLLTAAWGFTVETATAGIRMVLSEVFDEYPKLQIVLGHLGEGLPFLLWRISDSLARDNDYPFREKFCNHFPHHDFRQFFRSGDGVFDDGNGHRPDHVLGRLPVCAQYPGHRVDGEHLAQSR